MKFLIVYRVVLLLLGAVLFVNGVQLLICANFNLGTFLVLGLGASLLLFGFWAMRQPTWTLLHTVVAAGCLLLFLSVSALAVYGSIDNPTGTEDVVLVLGSGIRGETVPTSLANRLDQAAAYYETNPDALIVVSGGQGIRESVPEAVAMERYLLEKGVPAANILKETQSTSTLENFRNSDLLLQGRFPDGYRLTVITNRFHVFRAVRIAQKAGIPTTHIGAPTRWYTIFMNYLRELVAIAHELCRGSI